MKQPNIITLGMTLSLVLLAGCATPQAVLDQANNGVSMTLYLQEHLTDFHRVQASIAQGRVDSIRRQQALIAAYDSDSVFDARVLQAAGKTDELKLYNQLKELSDSRAKNARELQATLATIDVQMDKLVTPLRGHTEKLKETQTALAAFGTQHTTRGRVDLGVGFAKTLKKTLDDNKSKADAALEKASSKPAVQTAVVKP
ncbi:MAG: hypothetical protein K0M66_07620 [Thiobacillus sp.]|nr:hypothetical protein [Thiobacillus sp.]